MAYINGNEVLFSGNVDVSLVSSEELAKKADQADLEEVQEAVQDLRTIVVQGGVVNVAEVTATFSERTTAGGLNIVDGTRTLLKKVQGNSYNDADGNIVHASFSGITSQSADGADLDELTLDSPVELAFADYIDIENQQIVRCTETKTFVKKTQWSMPKASLFQHVLGTDGVDEAKWLINHGFTYVYTNDPASKLQDMQFTYEWGIIQVRCDSITTIDDWGAQLTAWDDAGTPLTLVYTRNKQQSTEDFTCPCAYYAYNGGTETVANGETVTTVQEYYETAGGA